MSVSLLLHGSILFHYTGAKSVLSEAMIPVAAANVLKINILRAIDEDKQVTKKILKTDEKINSIKKAKGKNTGEKKSEAKLIGKLNLIYPKISRLLGEEGVVTLNIEVREDGQAVAASIQKSSGHDRLDQYARKKALKARYSVKSSIENGLRQRHFLTLEVAFKIHDKASF